MSSLWATARGMHDVWGPSFDQKDHLIQTFSEKARLFGFDGIETPIVEGQALFERAAPGADIVSKELFRLIPRNEGDAYALRPEGTAPVMRAVLGAGLVQSLPLKFFYQGPMFRYDRPQKGRLRQFTQVGVESMGENNPFTDAETIQLAHTFLKALPLSEPPTLHLNTLGDAASQKAYSEKLVDYLTPRTQDLSPESQARLQKAPLRILDSKSETDQTILEDAPKIEDVLSPDSRHFFETLKGCLNGLGIKWVLDPRLVRGLDYYCHSVFEFKVSRLGAQNTVLAGGRYDKLSSLLGGPPMGGVGWAAGVERLLLLYDLERLSPTLPSIFCLPHSDHDAPYALTLAEALRNNDLAVSTLLTPWPLKKRLKKVAIRGGAFALIVGEDERNTRSVQVKDLRDSTQQMLAITDVAAFIRAKI